MIETDQVKKMILDHIPDADVLVEDLTGEKKNFAIDVISSVFAGKSIVQQHQVVYKALGEKVRSEMHAIKIHTKTK